MAQEEVQLPQLGESVTEGIITAWLVDVGDEVEQDQPLFELSTDKVDTEVPSPVSGVLTERRVEVDDTVEPGQVVAIIDTEGDATGDTDQPDQQPTEDTGSQDTDDTGDETEEQPDEQPEEQPEGGSAEAATQPAEGQQPAAEADYDVVILGAGTGGYSCALRAAQLGLQVALVERDVVGGTCLHRGCIPTKALLQSAEVAEHAQEAADFGVKLDYEGVEIAKINEHKDDVVGKMYKGLRNALKGRGVETVHGTGRLVSNREVEVETEDGTRTLTARNIVVATGSVPRELPFAPFDGKRVVSSDHALSLDKLPKKAVILGAGAIGMEFATAWHAYGVEVVVVELLDHLLPLEDADARKEIERAFRRKGITTYTGAKMTDVQTTQRSVTCTVETGKGETEEIKADLLLVAVGRAPVTDGAGITDIGIELDDKGFVQVDEYGRTSVEGVYALGDVIPTLMLAHASFQEGFLVADQLAGREVLPIDYKGVPRVTYCHPEVASVGLTEEEAREAVGDVVVEKYPFQALGRAQMMNASGMIKVVAEADEHAEGGAGRVLGIHIVGPRATDLISEAQLVYNWEALPIDVAHFIHAHPSLGEAMGEAHLALAGRALHG